MSTELVGVVQEPRHQRDPLLDGVVGKVAAQLLIAPTLEHLGDRLRLRMQQRNRAHNIEAAALVNRQSSLQTRLIQ
jgi:hypothetical protein